VIEAGGTQIPATVRDAVLARTARLSPSASALVDSAAIVPSELEAWLLEELSGGDSSPVDECFTAGVLHESDGRVAFRHELARITIEAELSPSRRVELHRRVLAALEHPPVGAPDLARLAHHADGAADVPAVRRYASAAAEHAATVGAHREAAAQYARALRFSEGMRDDERAELLERHSFECFLTGQAEDSIRSLEQALESYRRLGDLRKEGGALYSLSRRLGCAGRNVESDQAAQDAVALLEQLPPGPELAKAYGLASSISMMKEDEEGILTWASRALELAEELGDTETIVYALNNIGTTRLLAGNADGLEELERSLELARKAGLEDHAGRAFIHIGWVLARNRAYELDALLEDGIEYCREHGLDLWLYYLLVYRARSQLDRGRWGEAAEALAFVLGVPHEDPPLRILTLAVLGLLRARRGDGDAESPLQEAHALAEASGDLQGMFEVALGRAEAAWLAGDSRSAIAATETSFEAAKRSTASWVLGGLATWRRRAGVREDIPSGTSSPYLAQLSGEWSRAVEMWSELGCSYEAALALADADDEDALKRALAELRRLDAKPAATRVARELRKRGARGVVRGPRPSTQANAAGLTARELEVLTLVAGGLRNGEIAERLFLSRKTVDHHVSAILRKVGARTRQEAVAQGSRLGLLQHR
jgi:DNA-binding CsgD family transcriptional regulator/tetratricopeptide (TPR) repeat protein